MTTYQFVCQECCGGRKHKYGQALMSGMCDRCGNLSKIAAPMDYGLDHYLKPILQKEHD